MNVLNNLRKKGTSLTLGEDERVKGWESILVFTTKSLYAALFFPYPKSIFLPKIDFSEVKDFFLFNIKNIKTKYPFNSPSVIKPMAFCLIFFLDLLECNFNEISRNSCYFYLPLFLFIPPYLFPLSLAWLFIILSIVIILISLYLFLSPCENWP